MRNLGYYVTRNLITCLYEQLLREKYNLEVYTRREKESLQKFVGEIKHFISTTAFGTKWRKNRIVLLSMFFSIANLTSEGHYDFLLALFVFAIKMWGDKRWDSASNIFTSLLDNMRSPHELTGRL